MSGNIRGIDFRTVSDSVVFFLFRTTLCVSNYPKVSYDSYSTGSLLRQLLHWLTLTTATPLAHSYDSYYTGSLTSIIIV